MSEPRSLAARLAEVLHRRFLLLLLASYAIATLAPGFGTLLRDVKVTLPLTERHGSLITLMLGLLLFNAGLGVPIARFKAMLQHPGLLLVALATNILLPVALISLLLWVGNTNDYSQQLLLGFALVAAMPIAGSSTAWAQNAGGNMPLSLGLVVGSTLLSPLSTPVAMSLLGWSFSSGQQDQLTSLGTAFGGGFLISWVVVPSLAGMLVRRVAGDAAVARARPWLQIINSINLLLLNYSNASLTLPPLFESGDGLLVLQLLVLAVGLCLAGFVAGWLIARWMKADRAKQTSIMFGLGMNNNGVGLVLANLAWSSFPQLMLPVIVYNLVQHLLAGGVDYLLMRSAPKPVVTESVVITEPVEIAGAIHPSLPASSAISRPSRVGRG